MTKRRTAIAVLLTTLCAGAARADDGRTWHLLQRQADGGIAAVLHGMTKEECEFAKNRIEGNPATEEEKRAADAAQNKADAAFQKWLGDTGCTGTVMKGFGMRSYKMENGTCVRGDNFDPFWYTHQRTYSPHEVMGAECFQ